MIINHVHCGTLCILECDFSNVKRGVSERDDKERRLGSFSVSFLRGLVENLYFFSIYVFLYLRIEFSDRILINN